MCGRGRGRRREVPVPRGSRTGTRINCGGDLRNGTRVVLLVFTLVSPYLGIGPVFPTSTDIDSTTGLQHLLTRLDVPGLVRSHCLEVSIWTLSARLYEQWVYREVPGLGPPEVT